MKKVNILNFSLALLGFTIVILTSCGGDTDKNKQPETDSQSTETKPKEISADPKGIGEIKNVELTTPLNEEMVTRGQAIYDMKCSSCHKLDANRVVGPGWAGVTERRTPEWIMNFITNVDIMLDQDPEAQKMLEECLTRMPNQNISVGDSRDILEFMRKNDGVK